MNIKVLYNTFLVRLGIREILPKEAIRKIVIIDNKEELSSLPPEKFIIRDKNPSVYGRKTLIEKLISINNQIENQGYKLCIFEIYRDEDTQKSLRLQEYNNVKKEHPNYSQEEIEKILDTIIVKINNNNVGGHQTGGAVDLSICTQEGKELEMGTKYLEFNDKTKTYSKRLTHEQQKNRNLLLKLMKKADFVNYPNEWWHFSYGDIMWAAYKNKKNAIYGKMNVEF